MWVITGALGAGKTTAIARLMAEKPPDENWIVILNEFTESGIDALTVAGGARGVFDIRLVPGGCLCCAGELDFARQLRELTRVTRPDRLIIEPSGIGHPAAITEELMQHQTYGSLAIESIVCLVEPKRAGELLAAAESVERAQAEVADVLVLSKAELASDTERAAFDALVSGLYPPKRWSGEMRAGELPRQAIAPHAGERIASSVARSGAHAREAASAQHTDHHGDHDHDANDAPAPRDSPAEPIKLGAFTAARRTQSAVGRQGVAWTIDRSAVFARPRLLALLNSAGEGAPLDGIERFKGVFRTGPETWLLVQRAGDELSAQESSWRRDSRAEALFVAGASAHPSAIEAALERALAQPLSQ